MTYARKPISKLNLQALGCEAVMYVRNTWTHTPTEQATRNQTQ